MSFVLIPFMLLVLYLLVIRPQQKRVRQQQAVVASLAVGDEVMSSAGIIGVITALDDEVATMEVAPGVALRIARGAIARRMVDTASETPTVEPPRVDDLAANDQEIAEPSVGED